MGSVSSADYLLFNAPIGYTKNPLTNTQAFQEKGKGSRSSTPMLKSLLSIPPSKLTLDKLPFEIRSRISNELSQIDCLQLIRVCKSLYLSTVQRIYQNIKIDQNYSEFSDEYNFHESDSASQQFSCTYIKTPYNLKKFLLTHNNPKLIKSLLCINLPDSLNIYNAQFPDLLKAFLMTLNHLSKLVWIDKGFEYSFLQLIPNLSDLQTLSINITCFTSSWFDIHPTGKLKFPILKNLQIINFQANQALTLILDSSNFEFTTMSNLKISRLQNNDSLLLLVYPFDSLINDMGSSRTFKLSDINTISSIFTGRKFHHLSVLLLHDILVEPNETKIFIESVNLEILETLELSSISEYQLLVTNFNSVNDLKQSFLINIAHRLVNLKHLLIDYRESHRDSVPEFLMLLPKNQV